MMQSFSDKHIKQQQAYKDDIHASGKSPQPPVCLNKHKQPPVHGEELHRPSSSIG
jgi:hypothetical protein